jgi:hypothetical protein
MSFYTPEIKLSTKVPEGNGVLSPWNEDSTFTDNRKVVLNLSSPPSTIRHPLKKITIQLMSDPVNPLFVRVVRLPTTE